MSLTKGQQHALETALSGSPCFIEGPGGTGKSFLIDALYKEFHKQGKHVAVTALTGCAALLLHHVKAKTIHSWAGVGIGKEPARVIAAGINRYKGKAYRNWIVADVLIIDEISMMSPELLDLVNEVGKIVRRSSKPFGGIQVIFVGDFYQLPPVRKRDQDRGDLPEDLQIPPHLDKEFAFESETWKEVNPTVCVLDEIVRQSDPDFQEILLQARKGGTLSDKAIRLLQARQREDWKELEIKPTLLFTRRFEVDTINQRNLKALPFETRTEYEAHTTTTEKFPLKLSLKDEKVQRAIAKMDMNAPYQKNLELRVGAQVMLIHNMSVEDKLVNGSRGVLTGFTDTLPKLPIVLFKGHAIPRKVGEVSWESEEIEGLRRVQIPLVCAWAITIHKAQGATLDSALIDIGSSTFEKGQAYVALSRVRSLDSLWVWDLDPEAFKSHPKVKKYYESLSTAS